MGRRADNRSSPSSPPRPSRSILVCHVITHNWLPTELHYSYSFFAGPERTKHRPAHPHSASVMETRPGWLAGWLSRAAAAWWPSLVGWLVSWPAIAQRHVSSFCAAQNMAWALLHSHVFFLFLRRGHYSYFFSSFSFFLVPAHKPYSPFFFVLSTPK